MIDLNDPQAQLDEEQRQRDAAKAQEDHQALNRKLESERRAGQSTGGALAQGIADFGEGVGNAVSDMFSAETVNGPAAGQWGQGGTQAASYNAGAAVRGQQISGAANQRGQALGQQAAGKANQLGADASSVAGRGAPQTGYYDKYQFLGDNQRGVVEGLTQDAGDSRQQDQQLAALNNFASQGEGPSAAQAQLQAGSDAAQRSALSMARSGRGAGDSAAALRDASFQNAATQGTVAGQSAQLRAQETDAYRQRQLAALNAAMGGAGAIRGADTAAAQVAQGTRAQDQAWQQGLDQRAQFGTQTKLQQTQMNDAARQGLLQTGLGYDQLGSQTELGFGQLGQAGELGYAQLGQNALNSQADYELAQQQMQLDAAKANQSADLEKDSGITGLISSGAGAVMSLFSDERLKKDIKAERALARALGEGGGGELETLGHAPAYSYKYKDPTMPGTAPGTQRSSMAQDLERGPHGNRVVTDTPKGKMVNYDEVVKLTPGALTELNQRLHALEKSLGKRSAA